MAEFPVGAGPTGIALSPDGATVYTTNRLADTLSVIDVAADKTAKSISLANQPCDVVVARDGVIYVTCLGKDDVVQLEQLASVACPTLIFAGMEDPLFPPALLESYIPHFNNARIEKVVDSGHSPYFEQPAVFNELLEAHIQSAK